MEKKTKYTISVSREVYDAFQEASKWLGRDADEEIEGLMRGYVEEKARDKLITRIEKGDRGQSVEEMFSVDIWCEDQLCRSPKIMLNGSLAGKMTEKSEGKEKRK